MFCPTTFRPTAFPPIGRPAFAAGEAGCNEPRLPAGGATRLTAGRAKARWGGTAAERPAFGPSMVVRVGFTSSERTGATRLSWFAEIRTLLRATGSEFTNALRETAVNPLGARRLA